MTTQAAERPTVTRWGTGWDIPVSITEQEIDLLDGGTQTVYAYERVVCASLAYADIAAAVDADHGGDPAILAEAVQAALNALAPQVTALTDAVDTLILDSLAGA